ncbi:TPA: hypothetical protein H1008_02450 [archaeon]|nr:hypothetical protein [Candidatus Undinarchaeales archaeon SRR5007147.bin71]
MLKNSKGHLRAGNIILSVVVLIFGGILFSLAGKVRVLSPNILTAFILVVVVAQIMNVLINGFMVHDLISIVPVTLISLFILKAVFFGGDVFGSFLIGNVQVVIVLLIGLDLYKTIT